MSIRFEHAIDVARGPEQIFAILDDLSQTPRWVSRCTGIEKLSPGPNTVGTIGPLRIPRGRPHGHDGRHDHGADAESAPHRRYADKMMEVVVDFQMTRQDGGARLVHRIDIKPKSLMAKLFAPLAPASFRSRRSPRWSPLRGLVEGGSTP
jgi:carbon monoxide dehydrogenase subunit G